MNLKEFSRKIGIPVSTISKALGNYTDVNISTRKRIVKLALKYNYVPNVYAKTLATGINFSVGLVLPLTYNQIQKLTLIEFIEKIHSKLNSINIPVIMIFAKDDREEIEAFEKLINVHKVGLILLNDIKTIDNRIEYLDSKNVSYVTWGRCGKDPERYSWIDEDIEYSSSLAVEYMFANGHSTIGYIGSNAKLNYFALRKKFFVKALKNQSLLVNRKLFVSGDRNQQIRTKEIIKRLLLENNEITVLLISSHAFAIEAVQACNELNKKIGRDISLLSFDSNVLESLAPDITAIRQPVEEMSDRLLKLIQSKINNPDMNFNYLYRSRLIDNGSVINLKK